MANPRCYEVDTSFAVAASFKTAITATSNANVRPEVYDLEMGFSSAPADSAFQVIMQRFTAAGTNTSTTPTAVDPADPPSQTAGGKNNSVEPTYTAGLVVAHFALNQRATHRWNADPQGRLKMPATASNGLGIGTSNASVTPNFDVGLWFNE